MNQKPKILIVNDNLEIGGIQKSLINLLKAVHSQYDIDLMLFSSTGDYMEDVPSDIAVLSPHKWYSVLGLKREALRKRPFLFALKAAMKVIAKIFGRRAAMRLLGVFQKKIEGYDVAISYSHLVSANNFSNGCGDFVLDKVSAKRKICMVHCDYAHSGYASRYNNLEYDEFNLIACCSESVRAIFLEQSGIIAEKVAVQRNFYDLDLATVKAEKEIFDPRFINIVTVARLSYEKGVDRAIEAIHKVGRKDIRYYVVGSGPQEQLLKEMATNDGNIFFLGERKNPASVIAGADYLLVPSRHEAAPIVVDEARQLGALVLSTETLSAKEMLGNSGGIICLNNQEDITRMIAKIMRARNEVHSLNLNNDCPERQFSENIGEVAVCR